MNNIKRLKDTKTLVREIFSEHQDWNAKKIYDRYLILIGDTNKAVTLNAVQKHVEDLKEIVKRPDYQEKEKQWHLHATLDMSAEAIGHVFEVQRYMPQNIILPPSMSEANPEHYVIVDGKKLTAIPRIFTVRDARWIERLYAVKSLKKPELLAKAVVVYSLIERMADLSETSLDTTLLDEIISSNEHVSDRLERYFQFQALKQDKWIEIVKVAANMTSKDGDK